MDENTLGLAKIIKDIDFMVIFDEVKACVPYILPAVIGFVGFRKAWNWVVGSIQGA